MTGGVFPPGRSYYTRAQEPLTSAVVRPGRVCTVAFFYRVSVVVVFRLRRVWDAE